MDFKSELFKRDRVLNTFSFFGDVYLIRNRSLEKVSLKRNRAFSGNMPKNAYHAFE